MNVFLTSINRYEDQQIQILTMGSKTEIHETRDNKQITFDLSKQTILYWRRALLIRYFINLGKNDNVNIEWLDFDKKSSPLHLKEEKFPFEEKLPHPGSCKICSTN